MNLYFNDQISVNKKFTPTTQTFFRLIQSDKFHIYIYLYI